MKNRATGLIAYFLLAMNIWLSHSCPEGQFGSPCKPCPPSTYKDHSGDAVECKACPRNSGHVKQGSRTIRDCKCLRGYSGSPELGLPCQIRRCEPLPVPANGYIIGGSCSRNYGSDCNMGCTDGYEPIGSTQRYCIVNAWNAMAWSGFSLTCQAIRCPILLVANADPPTGTCTGFDLVYGTRCTFKCRAGYRLKGCKERVCKLDKTWSGDPTTCIV